MQGNEIVKVGFHGGEIEAVKKGNDVWVSVRRACEHLGIDADSQQKKLRDANRAPWSNTVIMTALDARGRKFEQFMLHLDSLPMWLATIDTGRVAEHVRPLLIAYQKEAAQVLRDHFFGQPKPSRREESPSEKEKRLAAKEERLARRQQAMGWELAKKIAARQCRKGLVDVYDVKLAEVLVGEPLPALLPRIDTTAEWKFPEQIAHEVGSTSQMVGRVITELWGKGRGNIDGIREVRMGTAPGHHKMIEQCAYSPAAVDMIKDHIRTRLVKNENSKNQSEFEAKPPWSSNAHHKGDGQS